MLGGDAAQDVPSSRKPGPGTEGTEGLFIIC
jgi:hypothetical protein